MARKYDYDVVVLGLGPAGMAVSLMGSEMGLKVCAIEPRKIGGECMNVGCIPSKALLRMAGVRHQVTTWPRYELAPAEPPTVLKPFARIRQDLEFINERKTKGMFSKVDLRLGEGPARFIDAHTVAVGSEQVSGRRIFIAVGTRPAVPPIPGLEELNPLTNETLFDLDELPRSLVVLGGGAIGCEMAQAFSRLGCSATIVHMDAHLIPLGDPDAGAVLESALRAEGIEVFHGRRLVEARRDSGECVIVSEQGEEFRGERVLVAAGRKLNYRDLDLDRAGVEVGRRGEIRVDRFLRTTRKHIFAIGDCNGQFLFSHSAMHQGMLALMNSMLPWPAKRPFRGYVVPWAVFTEPNVAQVGRSRAELEAAGTRFEAIEVRYADYGAAIAEGLEDGFVRVLASPGGRIYGVTIVGAGAAEMINEWALALQRRARLSDIMMLQHAFPAMGFLSKRVAETWMMNKMKSEGLRRISRFMFRLMP